MQRRYGVHTPRFEMTSFRDAVSTARTMSKFLLVFLHSNIHDEAIQFAKSTICTQVFTTYVNESASMVAWAGCVQQMEGFGVSLSLGCCSFPFVALLTCISRGVNVVEKISMNVPTAQLIRVLDTVVGRNNQQLMAARHAQQQRTEAQMLREQQDLEYQQ
jgi:FAS-associated factor 2